MKRISASTIVTTAGRTNEEMVMEAQRIADKLDVAFVKRNKKGLPFLLNKYENVLVVGKESLELYNKSAKEPYFFHPNLAMVRVKRLLAGKNDAFIDAAGLGKGDSLLDCTLGFASDSIVASFVVGESGSVTGIEGSEILSFLAETGLLSWTGEFPEMEAAMRRIRVANMNHYDYLSACPDKSVDVVYFDPMFEESIAESTAMRTMSNFTIFSDLNEEIITEAIRVARRKVVMKDHFRSKRFKALGFDQQVRKSSKFHFGTISVK